MSWSVGIAGLEQDDFPEVEQRIRDKLDEANAEITPEVEDQIKAAANVAQMILDSGAVGSAKSFIVNASGHANPGHQPKQGYGNDMLSVNVSQQLS